MNLLSIDNEMLFALLSGKLSSAILMVVLGIGIAVIIQKFSKNKHRYYSGTVDCSLLFMVKRRCHATGTLQCDFQRQTKYDPLDRQS